MSQQQTQSCERPYNDDPYLRSEHLFRDGKYIAVKVTIDKVVTNCPGKKGNKDTIMLGVAFTNSDKVLGLNRTNESLICWETGEGNRKKWVGKEITLCVRLIEDKRKKVKEPAIRVWPTKPHPNNRVREQMGEEIPDSWYATNRGE